MDTLAPSKRVTEKGNNRNGGKLLRERGLSRVVKVTKGMNKQSFATQEDRCMLGSQKGITILEKES